MDILAYSRRRPLFSVLVAYTIPLFLHPFLLWASLTLTGFNGGSLGCFFYASALYSIASLFLASFLLSLHAMTLSPHSPTQWLWATPNTLDAYLIRCHASLPHNSLLSAYTRSPPPIRFLTCFSVLFAGCTILSALYTVPASASRIVQLCWYLGLCKLCQDTFFTPPSLDTSYPPDDTPSSKEWPSAAFVTPNKNTPPPFSPITVCKNHRI